MLSEAVKIMLIRQTESSCVFCQFRQPKNDFAFIWIGAPGHFLFDLFSEVKSKLNAATAKILKG